MTAIALATAMILDALLGEPKWLWSRLPHPAVLMGRLIGAGDAAMNRGDNRRQSGVLLVAGLVLGAGALGWLIAALPLGWLWQVLIAAVLLAQKSLVDHVRAVADGLRISLGEGRRAVAMIVGRDVRALDQTGVARGAIESAAENLSDGVIAPAFWFLVAGLPGILIYKVINTADSMIGHRTPRHEEFGWAAARLDDLLNLIPARLTTMLIALTHGWVDPRPILRDAPLHRSPNAGWPEAAMAVVLNAAISGPRSYDGEMRDFPYVWPEGRHDLGPVDIDRAAQALWRAWAGMLVLVFLIGVIAIGVL
jgi:adenosylcobinamide-phosphate synthase